MLASIPQPHSDCYEKLRNCNIYGILLNITCWSSATQFFNFIIFFFLLSDGWLQRTRTEFNLWGGRTGHRYILWCLQALHSNTNCEHAAGKSCVHGQSSSTCVSGLVHRHLGRFSFEIPRVVIPRTWCDLRSSRLAFHLWQGLNAIDPQQLVKVFSKAV